MDVAQGIHVFCELFGAEVFLFWSPWSLGKFWWILLWKQGKKFVLTKDNEKRMNDDDGGTCLVAWAYYCEVIKRHDVSVLSHIAHIWWLVQYIILVQLLLIGWKSVLLHFHLFHVTSNLKSIFSAEIPCWNVMIFPLNPSGLKLLRSSCWICWWHNWTVLTKPSSKFLWWIWKAWLPNYVVVGEKWCWCLLACWLVWVIWGWDVWMKNSWIQTLSPLISYWYDNLEKREPQTNLAGFLKNRSIGFLLSGDQNFWDTWVFSCDSSKETHPAIYPKGALRIWSKMIPIFSRPFW